MKNLFTDYELRQQTDRYIIWSELIATARYDCKYLNFLVRWKWIANSRGTSIAIEKKTNKIKTKTMAETRQADNRSSGMEERAIRHDRINSAHLIEYCHVSALIMISARRCERVIKKHVAAQIEMPHGFLKLVQCQSASQLIRRYLIAIFFSNWWLVYQRCRTQDRIAVCLSWVFCELQHSQ